MTEKEQQVANLIKDAFAGIRLGDGVGLFEAQAIDDYADAATRQAARSRDETDDWSAISADDLNQCYSSLSFFDAEGMRFHLPAFLLADLKGQFKQDVIFALTYLNDTARFEKLSPPQRRAVRQFLLLRQADLNYEYSRPWIKSALEAYWTE
ncbi:MAG TPA: DUF6714 family protein [Gemmataceae bacterium]|jgi:hypothetical protein|nr:DUF6714 family protein [Gemmataceae bacterium]